MVRPPAGWVPGSKARPAPIPDPDVLTRDCCDDCGAMVADLVVHDAWHARVEQLERSPGSAPAKGGPA